MKYPDVKMIHFLQLTITNLLYIVPKAYTILTYFFSVYYLFFKIFFAVQFFVRWGKYATVTTQVADTYICKMPQRQWCIKEGMAFFLKRGNIIYIYISPFVKALGARHEIPRCKK